MTKLVRVALRILELPLRFLAWFNDMQCRERCEAHPTVTFLPGAKIVNPCLPDRIKIGAHSIIACEIALCTRGASVTIGEWCYIGPDTVIAAIGDLVIGDRAFISHRCKITDMEI